jgi:hypothetical protein
MVWFDLRAVGGLRDRYRTNLCQDLRQIAMVRRMEVLRSHWGPNSPPRWGDDTRTAADSFFSEERSGYGLLSPRQRDTQSCPEDFYFSQDVFDIALAQLPISREPADGERVEVIVQFRGTVLVVQVIRQDAEGPLSFAPRQVERAHRLTGPLHNYFPARAGPITFVCDSCVCDS